nr:MAG TPA: hypothetical protein [Caudoviricetes sp.]
MIKYNYEVSVNENRAKLNKDIFLFRGNRNIHYYFSIKGARFAFEKEGDLIENANAIYAAVTVIKPNGVEVANAIAPVENGLIHLKVTEDLIDEEVEIGDFDLVFDLFDDSDGAVTIPKIKGQFHVQERPCTTSIGTLSGNVNVVNQAVVDLAIATQENEQLIVVDDDGKYVKTTWVKGDKISIERLNKIEEGIEKNSTQYKDIANNQPTDLSLDSATNLLQLVNSKGSKLGNGITLPISSGGGTSQYLHIKYSTTGAPQLAGQISDTPNAYIGLCVDANADAPINPHSYTWYKWKGEAGAKGDTGATPSLQIGTVETLESGSSATASITGTTENPLLNLGIPRGEGGTGGSEKEWKLLKDLTLTETVSAITEIFDNDYKEILIIAKGKAGGTSNCGMAITSYSENQASGVDLVLSSILWQVNEECTFSIYLCAENPVLFLIWKRCNSSILSSSEGTYNSANWNDKKGINKLLFRYGTFAEGNNYKIYGR